MGDDQFKASTLSFHVYPEIPQTEDPNSSVNTALYPDLTYNAAAKKAALRVKRMIDIAGSLLAIALCAPLLIAIAVLIKLTSKGPILFRQQRIGHYGKPFTFLKFRSMYQNNDHSIHREYVTKLISSRADSGNPDAKTAPVYKLTRDPRVTRIGRFLRWSSLVLPFRTNSPRTRPGIRAGSWSSSPGSRGCGRWRGEAASPLMKWSGSIFVMQRPGRFGSIWSFFSRHLAR